MKVKTGLLVSLICLLLAACGEEMSSDEVLKLAVDAAIGSASDLPQTGLVIAVDNAVVTVSGTIECEECGGMQTPGGIDTIQQSLGAVIAAVPGVTAVEFTQN